MPGSSPGMTSERQMRPARNFSPGGSPRVIGGMRGAPEGCIHCSLGQPYGRPARGDIEARPAPCTSARRGTGRAERRGVQTQGPPRPDRVTPDAGRGLQLVSGRVVPRLPRAPHPFPTWRTVRNTLSLMGKGWDEFKGGAGGGDKFQLGKHPLPLSPEGRGAENRSSRGRMSVVATTPKAK